MFTVIRPWRLHPSHKTFTGNPVQKTDPVKLYHKYKEIWAQQKVPGENDHSQLRWTIREKMLGTDPHPRVNIILLNDSKNKKMLNLNISFSCSQCHKHQVMVVDE